LTRSGTVALHHSQFYPASVSTSLKIQNFTPRRFQRGPKFSILTRSGFNETQNSQFHPAAVPPRPRFVNFAAHPFQRRSKLRILPRIRSISACKSTNYVKTIQTITPNC
jgi:hypothetical protein